MNEKIGIVGFGVVGKSVFKFFQSQKLIGDHRIDIWDHKIFNSKIQNDITEKHVQLFDSSMQSLEEFIKSHDRIIPSPGVNLNDFYEYKHKFVCELDLFSEYFKKPTIAITGSLGKTTTAKLLGQLSGIVESSCKNWVGGNKKKLRPFTGGNVGLGMLDVIAQQNLFDIGVLEISSFQLEFSKLFAPDIALFTNCYPNHLDRHKTLQNYLSSKLNLARYQTREQYVIFSEQFLSNDFSHLLKRELQNIKSQVCLTFTKKPNINDIKAFFDTQVCKLFYNQNNLLILYNLTTNTETVIFDTSVLPEVTFIENWIQVITTLFLLGADVDNLHKYFGQHNTAFEINDHHHRVEYFASINGVDFYDDSKATVIQSALAATKRLAEKGPVILILGGLGKGVDRSPLCQALARISNLKKVYCFGPECADFSSIACKFNMLEEIVADIKKIMQPGDQVVLSPSGTSFDFYQNYKQRGQAFKDIVNALKADLVTN